MRTVDDPEGTLALNRVAMVATGAVEVGLPGAIDLGIWLGCIRAGSGSAAPARLLLAALRRATGLAADVARGRVDLPQAGWSGLPAQLKDPTWLRIGFIVGNYLGLLFLLTLVIGGVGIIRLRRGKDGSGLLKMTTAMSSSRSRTRQGSPTTLRSTARRRRSSRPAGARSST